MTRAQVHSTCQVCGCEITSLPRRCFDCRRKPPQSTKRYRTINLQSLVAILFVISLWCVGVQKLMEDHHKNGMYRPVLTFRDAVIR